MKKNKYTVIAIDGPAASGKSTIAAHFAKKINFVHIDSGLLYRAITFAIASLFRKLNKKSNFSDFVKGYNEDLTELDCTFLIDKEMKTHKILIAKKEVLPTELESKEITDKTRYVADEEKYREWVNHELHNFSKIENLVVDGRDIGSVVFPDAKHKFYLDSSLVIRAQRRLLQMKKIKNDAVASSTNQNDTSTLIPQSELEDMERMLAERDNRDANRTWGKLQKVKDATLINTSEYEIDEVVNKMLDVYYDDLNKSEESNTYS